MVETGTGEKNIFRKVVKTHITNNHHQTHGYFRLLGIGNILDGVLSNPLVVLTVQKVD